MKQVFLFGASIVHGVGGAQGWADRVKQWLHDHMYAEGGEGEAFAVYELGIPGDTSRDVITRFENEVLARLKSRDPKDSYIIFSVGTNDSKAIGKPDNFLYSADEYAGNVQAFINLAHQYAGHVLCVGLLPTDESKTNPKHNPLTNGESYFTNHRLTQFNDTFRETCKELHVPFVQLDVPDDWLDHYMSPDGLHPNTAGHQWVFEQVQPELAKMLGVKAES